MKLDEYLLRTKTTKKNSAKKVGISSGYLQHLLSMKNSSVKLAKQIEETGGKVTKEELLFLEDYPEKDFL